MLKLKQQKTERLPDTALFATDYAQNHQEANSGTGSDNIIFTLQHIGFFLCNEKTGIKLARYGRQNFQARFE
jgi:hypothetical protein